MVQNSPSNNALSPDAIVDHMNKALPSSEDDSQLLKNAYSAVALFCHACMLAVGFRLVGLGEDHRIEAHSDPNDARPLPSEWDASSAHAFRYAHTQSSMEYLIKVTRLGNKAIILGVGIGDDKTAQFEVKTQDYISEGNLKDTSSNEDRIDRLRNIFISRGRIDDLGSLFKTQIIQKLAPGIHKQGYQESTTVAEQPRRHDETRPPERDPLRDVEPAPARPYPFDDPLAIPRRQPIPTSDFPPPGFEDEYDLNRPARGMPGGRTPFGRIGEQDLYPPGLGPHDPLRIGPGGGGGFRGGGGMHPTFDDPLFGGQGGGTGGYDRRAPPGARYDPIGPGDGPPNLRGPRFPGGGGGGFGGGGFGGNPFGGFGGGDFI